MSDSQQNLNVLRSLVHQLQELLNQENQKCWGKPLGSQTLWQGNVQTIQRIQAIANKIRINEVCISDGIVKLLILICKFQLI